MSLLVGVFTAGTAPAVEYYTSPAGRTNALGTINDPLDFATAISSTKSPVLPGDTLWVRGGRYIAPIAGYLFSVSGSANRPVVVRNYQGERAMIDGTFRAHGRYVWYWGMEFTTLTEYLPSSLTRPQMEAQMLNGTYSFSSYYLEAATHSRFINNIFHDSYGQIEYGVTSSNSVFYGNIVLNMGQQCSNNERGVGLYTQNQNGTREVTDNVFGQNILNGVDIWSSGNSFINNYTVEGNICFNNGWGRIQGGRNMFSGAGNGCTNLVLSSNVLYYSTTTANKPNLKIGHGGTSLNPIIRDNLAINGGFEISESFGRMEFTGNELLSSALYNNMHIAWPRAPLPFTYIFSRNKYYNRTYLEATVWFTNTTYPTGTYQRVDVPNSFTGWNSFGTSFPSVGASFRPDLDSVYSLGRPTGSRAIVRPNRYESGRAHIAVMNFDLHDYVDVDVSGLYLPTGMVYELHPVQNLYNQTNVGTYQGGGTIRIPMTNWGVRQPRNVQRGEAPALSNTFPQFGAFLLKTRGSSDVVNPPPTITSIPDQVTDEDTLSNPITFTIGDSQVPASALVVSALSSNTTLVPNLNFLLSGTGAQRTLRIQPATNQTGVASIVVSVSDGFTSSNTVFRLTVNPINDPPTISTVLNQSLALNTPSAYLPVYVGDVETQAGQLLLTGTSSNPSVIPNTGISLTGSSWSRTLRVTPATGIAGQATITLTVSDGTRQTSTSFLVSVGLPASAPVISNIPDQTTGIGAAINNIPFTLSDADTPVATLTISFTSSNPNLIPVNSIILAGSGANRAITIRPTPGLSGSSVIGVVVSDGRTAVTESFTVTVGTVNTPPRLSSLIDATMLQNGTLGPLGVTVGDNETAASSLTFQAQSLQPTLIPAGNIVVQGTGPSRSLTLHPALNQVGTATILFSVSDGALAVTNSFRVTIQASSQPPTISAPPALVFDEDLFSETNFVHIVLSDVDTPLDLIELSVTSEDPLLIPLETLELSGTGADRWLSVITAPDQYGQTVLNFLASDGDNIRSLSIPVTVRAVRDEPGIAAIDAVTMRGDTTTNIVLTVFDLDKDDTLTVRARSDNQTLLPNSQLLVSGNETNRTLAITPSTGQSGSTQVHVSVSDGYFTNETVFTLTVSIPNRAPVVDAGTNALVIQNANFFLRGYISDDGIPSVPGRVTATWSQISGPGTVTFGTPNFLMTSARFSASGLYVLRLTATDGDLTSSDDTTVIVRQNTDVTPPVISELEITDIGATRFTVRWTTSEPADRQVEFTPSGSRPLNTQLQPFRALSHSVIVSNLVPGMTYSVRARSRDALGNRGISPALSVTTLHLAGHFYTAITPEEASITSPMAFGVDDLGDSYLETSEFDTGSAEFRFHLPYAATCFVWARIWSPSSAADSFYVAADGGAEDIFDTVLDGAWDPVWKWVVLNGRGGVGGVVLNPRLFSLGPGEHRLAVRARELNCRISRLLISNDEGFIPSDDFEIAGGETAYTLRDSLLQVEANRGWSMVGNPLNSSDARLEAVLRGMPGGVRFYTLNGAGTGFDLAATVVGVDWDEPSVNFAWGRGGMLFNPYDISMHFYLWGKMTSTSPGDPVAAGTQVLAPQIALRGSLADLLGHTFQAGDEVQIVDSETGNFRTHTFDGSRWNVNPTLNIGESAVLRIPSR